jgi:hypothetical protein
MVEANVAIPKAFEDIIRRALKPQFVGQKVTKSEDMVQHMTAN